MAVCVHLSDELLRFTFFVCLPYLKNNFLLVSHSCECLKLVIKHPSSKFYVETKGSAMVIYAALCVPTFRVAYIELFLVPLRSSYILRLCTLTVQAFILCQCVFAYVMSVIHRAGVIFA